MLSLLADRQFTPPFVLEYAASYHADREIVTRTVEGSMHRYGYAECLKRVKQAAKALIDLGVRLHTAVVGKAVVADFIFDEDLGAHRCQRAGSNG